MAFLVQLVAMSAFATAQKVSTTVEKVTIYHSGALVHRSATINLSSGVSTLEFEGLSSKIVLHSLKIQNKEITVVNKTIVKKLTDEEFAQLKDRKEALNAQLSLLESKYQEGGFVTEVEDLEAMLAYYTHKVQQLKRDLRGVEKEIKTALELDSIELGHSSAAILRVSVSAERDFSGKMVMSYVTGGIGWSPSYDISILNSKDDKVSLKYLAKIMSQTGEDWEDINISLSSSSPLASPNKLPYSEEPWTLGRIARNTDPIRPVQNDTIDEQKEIDRLEGVEYYDLRLPSFLKTRTLKEPHSIISNGTVFSFHILSVDLPSTFYYLGYPLLDPEVYLVAEISGWDTIGLVDGVANIMYAGNDVGRSFIEFSDAADSLLIAVGKDNSIFMKRNELADQKFFKTTTIGKRQKFTYAYEYILKNNNSFPIQIELIDQIPISQTETVSIKLEERSSGKIDNESGEIIWDLEIQSGATVKRQLIYTIEAERGYSGVSTYQTRKFKVIACPAM